jgi:carbon storage regulator CsrA
LLVLSRKQDESLVIGDNIIVTILSIDRDQVRLGIEAPRDIPILRRELFDAVREQNILAAHLNADSKPEILQVLRTFLIGQVSEDEEKPKKE